jgi:hypothetical protein
MPIDTPFNREIARQYNRSNRKRANYLQVHMSDMSGGELMSSAHSNPAHGNGYNMRMVGSGVGVYKKGGSCCDDCGEGKGACGGNNVGLQPKVRMSMDLGAGKPRRPATNAGMAGGYLGLEDLYEKGKKAVHKVKKVAHKVKKVYDSGKDLYDSGKDLYNEVRGNGIHPRRGVTGGAKRADIVRKVMREQGLGMIQASKYVKANNLY